MHSRKSTGSKAVRHGGLIQGSVCVLVSGGIDSCVLLGVMAQKYACVFPVYIRCGLRWEAAEIFRLKKYLNAVNRLEAGGLERKRRGIVRPLVVLDVPVEDVYGSHWSLPERSFGQAKGHRTPPVRAVPDWESRDEEVYLPGRNLLLLVKAAVFCAQQRIPIIAMGQLKGNPFPDATPHFLRLAEKTISAALNWRIKVAAPFLSSSKSEIVEMGRRLNLPMDLSFSCLAPDRHHRPCGRCNKCAERERALG